MGLRVNNNIAAFNSYRNLQATDKQLNSSLEKLSSGYRINKAADDAAGLVISEGLRSQISGLNVAARSAQDGVNVAQTADGALGTSTSILQRMRDLALQAKNDTNNTESRQAIKDELDSLSTELTRIAEKTSFNGVELLDGTFKDKVFQVGSASGDQITASFKVDVAEVPATQATFVGTESLKVDYSNGGLDTSKNKTFKLDTVDVTLTANWSGKTAAEIKGLLEDAIDATSLDKANYEVSISDDFKATIKAKTAGASTTLTTTLAGTVTAGKDKVDATTAGFTAEDLGLANASGVSTLTVDTAANATLAVDAIDKALASVSSARASIGALQNRFEHVINSVNVSIENLTASESAIRDTDMAAEMTKFTKSQILSQAGTSMLAQANSASQNILSLLRG